MSQIVNLNIDGTEPMKSIIVALLERQRKESENV